MSLLIYYYHNYRPHPMSTSSPKRLNKGWLLYNRSESLRRTESFCDQTFSLSNYIRIHSTNWKRILDIVEVWSSLNKSQISVNKSWLVHEKLRRPEFQTSDRPELWPSRWKTYWNPLNKLEKHGVIEVDISPYYYHGFINTTTLLSYSFM